VTAELNRCPECKERLESRAATLGNVEVCVAGHGGGTTLALLKRAVPESAAEELWLSARASKSASPLDCPGCSGPLAVTSTPGVEVCLRCQQVWVSSLALDFVRLSKPPSEGSQRVAKSVSEAQGASLSPSVPEGLAAQVILDLLLPAIFSG